jgi:osmotically-inducible protein OsmY
MMGRENRASGNESKEEEIMNKWIRMSALALLLGLGAVGCQNTAEGVKEDAEQTGEKVSQATQKAGEKISQGAQEVGHNVKEAAGDIGAATTLTPDVKSAITADPQLNDPKNYIDVGSTNEAVHLKGHVTSNELKKKAGEIAQGVLNKRNAKNKLSNELIVESR